MLQPLFGTDWTQSPAHLLLLSGFLQPCQEYKQGWFNGHGWDEWKEELRESPHKVIERMIADGLLVRADLASRLSEAFKVPELKEMSKAHGLPATGKKGNLIANLIIHDTPGMEQATANVTILVCSERGVELASRFQDEQKAIYDRVESEVLSLIKAHHFKEADKIAYQYKMACNFVRPDSMFRPMPDDGRLELMMTRSPKALGGIGKTELEYLGIAAAMFWIWGGARKDVHRWLPTDFQSTSRYKNESAVMLVFGHATFLKDIHQMRGMFKKVEITTVNDGLVCPVCREAAHKEYDIERVPELPHAGCMNAEGCRCGVIAAI